MEATTSMRNVCEIASFTSSLKISDGKDPDRVILYEGRGEEDALQFCDDASRLVFVRKLEEGV